VPISLASPYETKQRRLAVLCQYAEKMAHLPSEDFKAAVVNYTIRMYGVDVKTANSYFRVIELRVGYVDRTITPGIEAYSSEDDEPP
jgi:hypothetical protein